MKRFLETVKRSSLALLFFVACEGGDPNIETAKLNMKNKDFDKAIEATDMAIAADSSNAYAYYYKGYILSEKAKSISDPNGRPEVYQAMKNAFSRATNWYNEAPPEDAGKAMLQLTQIENIQGGAWGEEVNKALQLVQSDSTTVEDQNLAVAHMNNALVLQPDTMISYDYLGQIYLLSERPADAVQTYERAMDAGLELDYVMYRRMGELYSQLEQPDKQVSILNQAMESHGDSTALIIDLANAYINAEDSDGALSSLRLLIEKQPENAEFRLVYASRAYGMSDTFGKEMKDVYDEIFEIERLPEFKSKDKKVKAEINERIKAKQARITELEAEIAKINEDVIAELSKAIELAPQNPRAYYVLGAVHQNSAVSIQEKRNNASDKEYEKLTTQMKEVLRKAATNYEKATEINPDNKDYWASLFQVYTSLGENDKALEAMEKAGM